MRKQRWVLAVALGLLATIIFALPASAGRGWCSRDPIIRINGTDVQIWISIPTEYEFAVNGPVDINISLLAGTRGELMYTDTGFNGYRENVSISTHEDVASGPGNPLNVIVSTRVPFNKTALAAFDADHAQIPTQVSFISNGQLLTYEDGRMDVIGGHTTVFQHMSTNTRVTYALTTP